MIKILTSIFFITLSTLTFGKENQLYLAQGNQSKIKSPELLNDIKNLKKKTKLQTIKNILRWKNKTFRGKSAKGKLIGKRDINEIYQSKKITGCHDDGLVFVTVARALNIPSRLIDTTGITWSKAFYKGSQTLDQATGHVFVEVLIDSKWQLVDTSYELIIPNYDVYNPVIPIIHQGQKKGYYLMTKGKDTWDYGVNSLDDLLKLQKDFAKKINKLKITYPDCKIINLKDK